MTRAGHGDQRNGTCQQLTLSKFRDYASSELARRGLAANAGVSP